MNPTLRPRVLVIDERPELLRPLDKLLSGEAELLSVADPSAALELLGRERVAVILCEQRGTGTDGFEVLAACKRLQPTTVVVLLIADGGQEGGEQRDAVAIRAMQLGAFDYLFDPFDPEQLRVVVLRALGRAVGAGDDPFGAGEASELLPGIVGRSAVLHALADSVRGLASTDATVLLIGERGTGKREIARALHGLGRRASQAFAAVDCAALAGDRLELELFGRAGAAGDPRGGAFEQVEGGTIFLDEIGELRASLQTKLVRVLERRSVRRLGESEERAIDVRVIAATHHDLEAMVREGTFRADLWQRLSEPSGSVMKAVLRVPPLRERSEDIALLARRFLEDLADKQGPRPRELSSAALGLLRAASWPGNVRQLRAVIERASSVARGRVIDVDDLPPELRTAADASQVDDLVGLTWQQAIDHARDGMAPRYLRSLLEAEQGNVVAAAARAGIERESFYRLLRKYGVRADEFRARGG